MNQCGAPHVNFNLELWTVAEFTAFILSLACRQTQHIPRRLIPSSFTTVVKLIVSKPHPLLSCPRSMTLTFHYQPFFLNTVSPFPFPHNAGTDVLDDLHIQNNKPENFLQLTSEIAGMKCQGHPTNGSRDTADSVHCCSGTGHIIIDPTILIILRL